MKQLLIVFLLVLLLVPVGEAGATKLKILTPIGTYTPALATPSYPLTPYFKGVLATKGTSNVEVSIWAWNRLGMLTLDNSTFTVAADSTVTPLTYLPVEFEGFGMIPRGGDLILNSTSNIATGSSYCGELIASGSIYRWKKVE